MAERVKVYTPNLSLPLANSYVPRGTAGYTNTEVNELDQRKVNMYYEVSKNALSGQSRLSLAVRPGFITSVGSYFAGGEQGQTTYNLGLSPSSLTGTGPGVPVMFCHAQGSTLAIDFSGVSTIVDASVDRYPVYVGNTIVNAQDYLIVQNVNRSPIGVQQTVFYTSSLGQFSSATAFTRIVSTFTTFTAAGKMEFMDGYGFIADSATNRIQNSNLNTISTWPAENFITKQATADAIRGIAKFKNRILAFGNNTVEVFYNAGLSPAPLAPIKTMTEYIGILGGGWGGDRGEYYTICNGIMYFIGVQSYAGTNANPSLMSFNGERFEKVSPPYIDKYIQDRNTTSFAGRAVYSIESIYFNGQVAVAINNTFPHVTSQKWLMYFPQWNDWFEWESEVISPINNFGTFIGTGTRAMSTFAFTTSSENYRDNTTSYSYLTQFRLPTDVSHLKKMPSFGVEADTARATNNMTVEFSDDDGQSWMTGATIDLSQSHKMASRGGSFRERYVRLSGTTSTAIRIHKFLARIEE